MSLYIRHSTGFYSHRKTIRLRSLIGDDAFWVPPRLWAYCATNQPDGDFSDYTPEEIALLIDYRKDAQALQQALQQAGFLDSNKKIHGWDEHNAYHAVFSDRAKKAAAARWGKAEKESSKEKEHKKGKDKSKHQQALLEAMQQASLVYDAYPKKVAKAAALKSIVKAMKKIEFDALLQKTKNYADSTIGKDPQFIPHPATWFNQERYNDDFFEGGKFSPAKTPSREIAELKADLPMTTGSHREAIQRKIQQLEAAL